MTWQQAQEKARQQQWGNFIFAPDNQAVIGGTADRGFIILVKAGCMTANTNEGVQRIIEELNLPATGWN